MGAFDLITSNPARTEGELATFVVRKVADVAGGAVGPLVDVDVHAMWKDPRAGEPLSLLP